MTVTAVIGETDEVSTIVEASERVTRGGLARESVMGTCAKVEVVPLPRRDCEDEYKKKRQTCQ